MDIAKLEEEMRAVYEDYEQVVALYKSGAVCHPGCAFCCTHFGTVDITTLEGWVIDRWLRRRQPSDRDALRRKINRNRKRKQKGTAALCPFLDADDTCRIYPIRPFSCRQLYSVRPCDGRGPTIHRQAREAARKTIVRLQRLDGTGYSGHISYILHLLDQESFRKVYRQGRFDPAAIAKFGKKYGFAVNRAATAPPLFIESHCPKL